MMHMVPDQEIPSCRFLEFVNLIRPLMTDSICKYLGTLVPMLTPLSMDMKYLLWDFSVEPQTGALSEIPHK